MPNYSKVVLIGTLTRDPELRYAASGTGFAKCAIAINRKVKGEKLATFVDFTLFGKRAESFCTHFKKGAHALIEGTLVQENWVDKQTQAKRSKLCVEANDWSFVGDFQGQKPHEGEAAAAAPAPAPWDEGVNDAEGRF